MYNVIDLFHGLNFHSYLKACEIRFKLRKTRWVLDDEKNNKKIELESKIIHDLAFSAQMYFALNIGVSGMSLLFMGVQVLYGCKKYNIFFDNIFFILIAFWVCVCWMIEKLCLMLAKWLKIWGVKEEEYHIDGCISTLFYFLKIFISKRQDKAYFWSFVQSI